MCIYTSVELCDSNNCVLEIKLQSALTCNGQSQLKLGPTVSDLTAFHVLPTCMLSAQACYNQGTESVVVPKTSSAGDSGWMGIAKYAWSG